MKNDKECSIHFLDDAGKSCRSGLTIRHGEKLPRRKGQRVELSDIERVSDGWDLLQVDKNIVAVNKYVDRIYQIDLETFE